MTQQEIERHVAAGGLDEAEIADLWHALYLTVPEVNQFLQYVKKNALQPFIYTAVCSVPAELTAFHVAWLAKR